MADRKTRWVVLGVSDETRRAVTTYAAVRDLTIAQVLEDELAHVRRHVQALHDWQRLQAAAETSGDRELVADGTSVDHGAPRGHRR